MLKLFLVIALIVLCVACPLSCLSVCIQYISERNIFRDKWFQTSREYIEFVENTNYTFKEEIEYLRKKLEEKNNVD